MELRWKLHNFVHNTCDNIAELLKVGYNLATFNELYYPDVPDSAEEVPSRILEAEKASVYHLGRGMLSSLGVGITSSVPLMKLYQQGPLTYSKGELHIESWDLLIGSEILACAFCVSLTMGQAIQYCRNRDFIKEQKQYLKTLEQSNSINP